LTRIKPNNPRIKTAHYLTLFFDFIRVYLCQSVQSVSSFCRDSQAARRVNPWLNSGSIFNAPITFHAFVKTLMNLISQILPLPRILVDLDAASKKRAFEQAGLLFENSLHIARSQVFESLFVREKLGSTGLGQGVAIPHGRIKGLRDAAAAFIRMKTPIPFDAPDGRPVSLMCVLLVPAAANDKHLQILSELAQMFSDKPFRETLLNGKDAADIYQTIQNWKP